MLRNNTYQNKQYLGIVEDLPILKKITNIFIHYE